MWGQRFSAIYFLDHSKMHCFENEPHIFYGDFYATLIQLFVLILAIYNLSTNYLIYSYITLLIFKIIISIAVHKLIVIVSYRVSLLGNLKKLSPLVLKFVFLQVLIQQLNRHFVGSILAVNVKQTDYNIGLQQTTSIYSNVYLTHIGQKYVIMFC